MCTQKVKTILLISFCFVLLGLQSVSAGQNDLVKISVDPTAPGKPLRHVWQYFGYDECNYTTSQGARELMETLADINPEPVSGNNAKLLNSKKLSENFWE